jgi:iron complex transport system ATP-binding protein
MLKVENVHYNIAAKNILNGISIGFSPGLFHVIVGPNGSGKSTFLKVFSGELHPQQGQVFYDEKDIFKLEKTFIARRRSVMSQQPELHFPLSVAEIVMMGRYPHFNYQPSTHDKAICAEVIHQMEIKDFLNRDYLTLSGGEKQRVQFARALAQIWETPRDGSRYLFLDEPINNLDIHYQHQFLQLAKAFTSEHTVTIAVLHDINLAIQYADTISFMKAGKIVSTGHPQNIITSTLIDDVFSIPVDIISHPSTGIPLIVYSNKQAITDK